MKTALVTGGNSGLGFEAAAQLAEQGWSVIITTRSAAKAEQAVAELNSRVPTGAFRSVTMDLGQLDTVEAAARELAGETIDYALLNAGIAPPKELAHTEDGIEQTVAASLIGHHLLTMKLLETGSIAPDGSIVIAGSEASRGDVPTFKPVDIDAFAAEHFGGDLRAAIEAYIRMEAPATYKASDTYATAKLFVAWWADRLAERLPEGITVNAVSPGSTPDTNAITSAPFYMRRIMVPLFKLLPGMSHSVEAGASRYHEIAGRKDVTGKFFASKPRKMTGPLVEQTAPHFDNPAAATALWDVVTKVAGGVGYPSVS